MKWYERSFGSDYLALYPHRDDTEAERDIASLVALIDPPANLPLLDLGCGAGRHLLALHRRGFSKMVGIDLSADLLDAARARLEEAGAENVELLQSDMREIPFCSRFATIISMFTSFGYFDSSDEDARMLAATFSALRPGGTFVLDTLGRRWTIDHLQPHEERTIGDLRLDITRSITPGGQRVEKKTRVFEPGRQERVYRESVRMYGPDELRGMLAAAAFDRVDLYGSLAGVPFNEASPRTVVVSRKAA